MVTGPRLVSVTAAARELGVSARKVHDLIAAGHLRARTLPGETRPRVIHASIREWLDADRPDAPERRVVSHPMVVPPVRGRDAA